MAGTAVLWRDACKQIIVPALRDRGYKGTAPTWRRVELGEGLQRDEDGFLTSDQPFAGLLGAGCAKRPVDVAVCVRDATGAALKALQCCVEHASE